MNLNGMSATAKWISAIIAICIFFGGIIISMATIPTRDLREDVKIHTEQINNLSLQQAVIETKLDNIQEDVKEIKEAVAK